MDLYIDHIPGETRLALMDQDDLSFLRYYHDDEQQGKAHKGALFRGRVVKVVASLQAAFVDLGQGPNGYLPVQGTLGRDISQAVHEGEDILVQVRKEAFEDKGPLLSQKVELAASDMVLSPHRAGLNLSRKIDDKHKREQMTVCLQALLPEGQGLVVRTHGAQVDCEGLRDQLKALLQTWDDICAYTGKCPAFLGPKKSYLERMITDLEGVVVDRVLVQSVEGHAFFRKAFSQVVFVDSQQPLFETSGIEDQIHCLSQSEVGLAGGGSIVIEPTRALVAIDVNQGPRREGTDIDTAHLRTNLAALDQVMAQVEKRNLAGQILVDFINLKKPENRQKLKAAIENVLINSDLVFHGFTRLGLGEFSRQRNGLDLMALAKSPETLFYSLLRQILRHSRPCFIFLGSRLKTSWDQSPPVWLKDRLGYMPEVILNPQFEACQFEIREDKDE